LRYMDATGIVHALWLRIQALPLPVKTLVLSAIEISGRGFCGHRVASRT